MVLAGVRQLLTVSRFRRSGPGALGRLDLLATIAIFAVAAVVLLSEASQASFEGDEADYIATSRYFSYLFLERDPTREEWGDNHWTRTQPPLTRYVLGAWLTVRGHDLAALNQPYVSTASSVEVNRRKGRVPDDQALAHAREPMAVLGAAAIALLYPLGVLFGGPLAGGAAALLALSSPFVRYTLVHAWAEPPLACFLTLSALLAAIGARRMVAGPRAAEWLGWSLWLGIALGLACSAKLTGFVGMLATLGWGVGAALATPTVGARHAVPSCQGAASSAPTRTRRARPLLGWALLSASIGLALFVALNPYLWRGPVQGVQAMLRERAEEMAVQQRLWPEYAVLDPRDRPGLTVAGSMRFGPWAETAASTPIGLAFMGVGLVQLLLLARAHTPPPGGWPAVSTLLLWLAGYAVAISGGLGLSYPRYFLPTCLLVLPAAGLAVARAISYQLSAFSWRLSRVGRANG